MAESRKLEMITRARELCDRRREQDQEASRADFLLNLAGLPPADILDILSVQQPEGNGPTVGHVILRYSPELMLVYVRILTGLSMELHDDRINDLLVLLNKQCDQLDHPNFYLGLLLAAFAHYPSAVLSWFNFMDVLLTRSVVSASQVFTVLKQSSKDPDANWHIGHVLAGRTNSPKVMRKWFVLLHKLLDQGIPPTEMLAFLKQQTSKQGSTMGDMLVMHADSYSFALYLELLNRLDSRLSMNEMLSLVGSTDLAGYDMEFRLRSRGYFISAVKKNYIENMLCFNVDDTPSSKLNKIKSILCILYCESTTILGWFFNLSVDGLLIRSINKKLVALESRLNSVLKPADTAILLDVCHDLFRATAVPEAVRKFFDINIMCAQFCTEFDAGRINKALMIIQLILTHETSQVSEARYVDILSRMVQMQADPSIRLWKNFSNIAAAGRMKDVVTKMIFLPENTITMDPALRTAKLRGSVEACYYSNGLLYQIIHLPRKVNKSISRGKKVEEALNKALNRDGALRTEKTAYMTMRGPVPAAPSPEENETVLASLSRHVSSFFAGSTSNTAIAAAAAASPTSAVEHRSIL